MRHTKGIGILIVLLLTGIVSSGKGELITIADREISVVERYSSSFETHDEIEIISNANFSIQGWPGNGTAGNPYVIEGLEIDGFGTDCVYIENTDVYFVIRNCQFEASWRYRGISLSNVTRATIEDCVIHDCSSGIRLFESPHCTIKDNQISDTQVGISVNSHSDYASIFGNSISSGGTDGIAIYSSPYAVVENNTIFGYSQSGVHLSADYCSFIGNEMGDFERFGFLLYDSWYGEIRQNNVHYIQTQDIAEFDIFLQKCHHWTIEDNLLNGDVRGNIELDRSTECIIANNSMNRGIFFNSYNTYDYSSHLIASNTVQEKQLGYFNYQDDLILSGSDFGQIILVFCDNVDVDGGLFTNTASTITLESCENVSLQGLSLVNSFHGINVRRSTNVEIQNCEVDSSLGFGVYLYQSSYLTLHDIHISSTTTGLSQWGRGIYGSSCNHLTISQSTLTNNTPFGIELSSVSDSTLDEITGENNYWCDISLSSCLRLTLTDCNLESGITFWGASESTWKHTYSNVNVGGLPFGYFDDRFGLTIDGSQYGQIVVVDSENVEVKGARINGVTRGVSIGFCQNCSVIDCEISAIERGCYLYKSEYCLVENVELTKSRSTIGLGSQAGLAMYSCNNSIIRDCQVSDLYVGVAIDYCSFINVTACRILRNSNSFRLDDCTYCNIIGNQFFHNRGGLVVTSNYSVIYNNEFWNQTNNQAADSGWYNMWDNGVDTGNAWSDYSGTGVYYIYGSANATDRYPRLFVPPLLSGGVGDIVLIVIGIVGITSAVLVGRRRKEM